MKKPVLTITSLVWICFFSQIASHSLHSTEHSAEKPSLLLYYLPWCPYSQYVLNFLQSIHKTVPMLSLQNNAQGREDLRRIGGKTQVPCLIIDGCALYESRAIIEWLEAHQSFLEALEP